MKRVIFFLIIFIFSSSLVFAELTLEEAQEFFANPQKLYEPPDEEFNKRMEEAAKQYPDMADEFTPSEGYHYPAVDIYQFWQKAGIEPEVLTRNTKEFLFGYKPGGPEKFNLRYPEAKLYSSDKLKILQIGSSSGAVTADYQFLVFKKKKDKWVYLDYVYALWENYYEPTLAFLEDDLFYIRQLGGSGTGISEYDNIFYTVDQDKVIRLLVLPSEGHVSGWGMLFNREYSSKMNYSQGVLTLDYTIDVDANTNYYEPKHFKKYKEFPLFKVKRKVVFQKEGNNLKINSKSSQLSKEDLDNLFNGGYDEYYAMFKEEFDKLKESDAKEKEWYKIFVASLKSWD
ncbi:MAG: hypothetical protein K9L76_00190 [Candidatus Omnitrophica bacterium]|nr:hypothetical protein [Candidatus Omnitrophota bacterium]